MSPEQAEVTSSSEITRSQRYAANEPGATGTDAGHNSLLCSSVLLLVVASLVVYAQRSFFFVWPLLTDQGYYRNAEQAWYSLIVLGLFSLLGFTAPRRAIEQLRDNAIYRTLKNTSVILGVIAIYPFFFDYYFDISITTRLLIAVAWIGGAFLAIVSSRFVIPYFILVNLIVASFQNTPPFVWDTVDTVHYFNAFAVVVSLIVAHSGLAHARCAWRRRYGSDQLPRLFTPDITTTLLALGFAMTTPYAYAAVAKLYAASHCGWLVDGVSWIWREDIGREFLGSHLGGQAWITCLVDHEVLVRTLSQASLPLNLCVFAAELFAVLFLFSKRATIGMMLLLQAFHVTCMLLFGFYFWYWVVFNFIFIYYYAQLYESHLRSIPIGRRVLLTGCIVLLFPLVFNNCFLGWLVESDLKKFTAYRWHVIVDDRPKLQSDVSFVEPSSGLTYLALNPNDFYPHEKTFQMSWRFMRFLSDTPAGQSESLGGDNTAGPDDLVSQAGSRTRIIDQSGLVGKIVDRSPGDSNRHQAAGFFAWYKGRLTGEPYNGTYKDPQRIFAELGRFLERFHVDRREHRNRWPAYYSHMYFPLHNWPEPIDLSSDRVKGFAFVEHEIHCADNRDEWTIKKIRFVKMLGRTVATVEPGTPPETPSVAAGGPGREAKHRPTANPRVQRTMPGAEERGPSR